jgi:hypothetical protein
MEWTEGYRRYGKVVLIAAAIVILVGMLAVVASAAEDGQARVERKIRVMERVLDEILVQSPNVLVGAGGGTRGLALEGYGAVFVIDASLGEHLLWAADEDALLGGMMSWEEQRAWGRGSTDEERTRDRQKKLEDGELNWEKKKKEAEEKRQQRFDAFKAELIDALVDYGPTLSELGDDQWVALEVFLGEQGLFGGNRGTRLEIKVKIRQLRQHSGGGLSRDAVKNAIVVTQHG